MHVVFKDDMLIVVPDGEADTALLDAFTAKRQAHLLRLNRSGSGMQLVDLGHEDAVRNTPINITSNAPEPFGLISNFAHTPFTLDGRAYASIEGFWQGLKLPGAAERERVAALFGQDAKRAVTNAETIQTFDYEGSVVRVGMFEHWQLMRRACWAKFSQNEAARKALLATGDRPLMHRVRRDSRTIPGVIMADIWMGVRARLREEDDREDAARYNEAAG